MEDTLSQFCAELQVLSLTESVGAFFQVCFLSTVRQHNHVLE